MDHVRECSVQELCGGGMDDCLLFPSPLIKAVMVKTSRIRTLYSAAHRVQLINHQWSTSSTVGCRAVSACLPISVLQVLFPFSNTLHLLKTLYAYTATCYSLPESRNADSRRCGRLTCPSVQLGLFASQSGMKAEKRARAACPHATVTHTDTRQNPPLNSTIKHGNGACVLHTTSV
jgi:hypothetical protein